MVRLLLDHGADIHSQDDRVLCWAAENGHLEVVRLLLDHGADIHVQEGIALRKAAGHEHLEVVKLLIDRGADIHTQGDNPLYLAAEKGPADIVMLLIAHGADIDVGIEAAKGAGNGSMLDLLNQIKLSREETRELSIEVPLPGRADKRIRM